MDPQARREGEAELSNGPLGFFTLLFPDSPGKGEFLQAEQLLSSPASPFLFFLLTSRLVSSLIPESKLSI